MELLTFQYFLPIVAVVALVMLVWDCIEVGRNDAANIINAVFGARVMSRRTAVVCAGIAVVLGASFASPVMETARKGIFDPAVLTIQLAMTVYITAYIVDTALLHTYSAFGMPVSTTASLVFELIGASVAVAASVGIVHWDKVGMVILAIVLSIVLSGIAGWMMQRVFRGAMGKDAEDPRRVGLHGNWISGLMIAWLTWFMVMKGMKGMPFIKGVAARIEEFGPLLFLLVLWAVAALVIHFVLVATGQRGAKMLFRITAVLGMLCLAFAFGQNDLANCASPGLSSLKLWQHAKDGGELANVASKIPIPVWAMFGCGVLMVMGMGSRTAQRVTRAAVNTGSQYDHVALYAPKWCRAIAKLFIRKTHVEDIHLAPEPERTDEGKRIHFDPLRASVITSVSAGVIAFASSRGLPVSTTYVAFAAVVATGWADGVMVRGDADRKIGRAIWVVFSWFAGALMAMLAAGVVAFVIAKVGVIGIVIGLGLNLGGRFWIGKRSIVHEQRHHSGANAIIREKESGSQDEPPPNGEITPAVEGESAPEDPAPGPDA